MSTLIPNQNYIQYAIQNLPHLSADYRLKSYKHFGHSRYSYELARDLLAFRDEAKLSSSPLSFWAVFEQSDDLSAAEFEKCLVKEVSSAATHPEFTDIEAPEFGSVNLTDASSEDGTVVFKLDGTVFSVLGLHPHTHSTSLRFPHPTLIFTVSPRTLDFEISQNFPLGVETAGSDLNFSDLNLEYSWPVLELSGRESQVDWKFPIS